MNALHFEAAGPDLGDTVGFTDLALACAMSLDDVRELIEFGALLPLESANPEPVFAMSCMEPLRTACQLRRDYDLDLFMVVLVLDYLRRIDQLESQLRTLQAKTLRASH